MKSKNKKAGKELYRELRNLSWEQLWTEEVSRFDKAPPRERSERASVVRAVGVVHSESGDPAQKEMVTLWLRGLLQDPCEKIRRYAMAALPKIGAGAEEESALLSLLQNQPDAREKKFLARALEKIGGTSALQSLEAADDDALRPSAQKIRAGLARSADPSAIRLDGVLSDFAGLRVNLRGRRGLEAVVREEAEKSIRTREKFRVKDMGAGRVALEPAAPFSLDDLYTLRCFGVCGFVPMSREARSVEEMAAAITDPVSLRVLHAFTAGAIRYRLNFIGKGHQRSVVRQLAEAVYARCPEILNDPRSVTWTVDIFPDGGIELRPNLTPDSRFSYRLRDVPAASHPQLAACMARLAGPLENEVVWDPFCGSGVELIERAILGGVRAIYGTDLSTEAISIAQANFTAAPIQGVQAHFINGDFRDFTKKDITLIITNPPMGMRVPVNDLCGLIEELFNVAANVLRPGGRLVLANPVSAAKPPRPLQLVSSQMVDMGGFDCRLQKYIKRSS